MPKPLELNADFRAALESIEAGHSLFITGRAGSGKSTLLNLFRRTTNKRVVVVAPTGIAALHVKGQTIHSFFGFPPKFIDPSRDIKKRRYRRLYEKMEVLVIDEISMVRADMLDNIDYFLRLNRGNPHPFGGVQVVFFGDLFQLPPVVSTDIEKELFRTVYDSPFFFSAHVLMDFELEHIELRKVYRQDNPHFLRILEGIRRNMWSDEDLKELNQRYDPDFDPPDHWITLSARNYQVNKKNQEEMDKLTTPPHIYQARITGQFKENLYPTDQILILKLGAQAMCLKNDPEGDYVNGTIGRIVALEKNSVTLEVSEGDKTRRIEVGPAEWQVLKYKAGDDDEKLDTETLGTFSQIPLKPAWAVTIHKAQGKTFNQVMIDLGRGAFAHGQTYVALSRCRTLEGIVLKQPILPRDIVLDERIVDYYERVVR